MSTSASVRVSAVVTTYNYAAFIGAALDSVLNQTRQADEVVVIDDGSTDDTAAIVARYAPQGVRYVWQENQGAGAARNRGITESRGELIAFLDADDLWLPGKLERQVAYLAARPESMLVSGQMVWWHVRKDERHIERFGVGRGQAVCRELAIRNIVGNPSMTLIRRAALEAAGPFDVTLRWGQDWEMFIRLARLGEIGWLDEPVITYRWHGGSLSHANRWERLDTLQRIAARAVANYTPTWERALLWEHAWSAIELDRARLALSSGRAHREQVRRALAALVAWPFDDPRVKAEFATRSLLGERGYQRLRRVFKGS